MGILGDGFGYGRWRAKRSPWSGCSVRSVLAPGPSRWCGGAVADPSPRNALLGDRLPAAVSGERVDDEDADGDVDEGPHRVVGNPPDGADGCDGTGEDADPAADL